MPAGSDGVDVGTAIMVVVEEESDIPAFAGFVAGAEAPAAAAAPEATPSAAPAPAAPAQSIPRASGARVVASPFARKTAAEKGIDLSQLSGTGPNGRTVSYTHLTLPTKRIV
eukprot:TRINITY_DN3645_c0_g1_i1.p3 TRINITY_DN3645_c0_g1~~TRINITY_DN3645_c0_g1_i1.p3  ORF type:complete len:112 (+),score=24.09 TRINITY_DN3645_c0_g1_i1:252-587(+)